MNATKRPWKMVKLSEKDRDFAYRIDGAEKFSPCLVYRDGTLNKGTSEANARLIIKAVNNFDAVLEALKRIEEQLLERDKRAPSYIRAAIAKAQED